MRNGYIMKHSIKRQFAAIFILLMIGSILLCWFLNTVFLEKYYIKNKQKVLKSAYQTINTASNSGSILSKEFDIEMQNVCGKYNITMVILDVDAEIIKSSMNNADLLSWKLLDNFYGYNYQANEVLEENEKYIIQNSVDERVQSEFIEIWGILDNGNLFLIRSAVEGIKDSVTISNRFLMYAGLMVAFASGIIIWGVTKKITGPIYKLANISEKMANLNFEEKYMGKSKNELFLLGNHMNQLSQVLEKTISELKTANNQLRKDIAKKEEIDEMRKEFLSNVSHELKTPIALIQGYSEGLKEGINDDEENKNFYCEVIIDEAIKMNHMVQKLLNLNQLEFGQDVVSMERFDISSLIRTYVQASDILLKQKEVTVRFQSADPIYVWADEFKVEEVINNYFTNALNHVSGKKIIEIKIQVTDLKVRIIVFNTGMPIPEDCLPFVWDKFYKVDKARTREYGGNGVGLSIVKAIMESMNEQYGVNNYQNGVAFWFELEKG